MKYVKRVLIVLIIFYSACDITNYNPADGITTIYLFDSYIRQENLSALLSNKLADYEAPIKIYIAEEEFKGTAEAQGSGSRYIPKWSFEIELDEGKIFNLDNFNLSAQVGDQSMLRTTLASFIYKEMGFDVFDSDYAFLKINGENKGLYNIIERVEENFFHRRNIPVYEVINTLFGARFTFSNQTNLYEFFEKEINNNDNLYNFENFINALDTVEVENIFSGLSEFLDINSYLKYHAVSTVIAAKDGFRNNIIFYKKTAQSPYEIIPWDFDATFNPTFSPILYGDNEIIQKLITNDSCAAIYNSYFNFCLENVFTESNLIPLIDETVKKVRKGYELDPYLGEAGYNIDREAEELKQFISQRILKLRER
jgi:spore coat protein H